MTSFQGVFSPKFEILLIHNSHVILMIYNKFDNFFSEI